jgi:alcohol dehydrogenase (cytochrome c)
MATAGGLVFGSANEGHFFALDARTGELLWRFSTGGSIVANPISYLVDGKQYVAIPAGSAYFAFSLDGR